MQLETCVCICMCIYEYIYIYTHSNLYVEELKSTQLRNIYIYTYIHI